MDNDHTDLDTRSQDPADLTQTQRVLTIMAQWKTGPNPPMRPGFFLGLEGPLFQTSTNLKSDGTCFPTQPFAIPAAFTCLNVLGDKPVHPGIASAKEGSDGALVTKETAQKSSDPRSAACLMGQGVSERHFETPLMLQSNGAFMTKRHILTFETYDDWDVGPMEAEYTVHNLPYGAALDTLAPMAFDTVEAFAFRGHGTLGAAIMDAFPKLAMIANYGVGFDTIDVAHATSKGIRVSNTPDVLTQDVADLVVGMVIAQSRGMVGASDWVRTGDWASKGAFGLQRKVSGRRVGIVGLGRIGRAVAQRLAPFECDLHYYARTAKDTPGWTHHKDIVALAGAVEILIVCVSGGPETISIVGKSAIEALGPEGLLINASRGTTIDETALLDALETGALGAAGLDVFLDEPQIDPRFLQLDNVLLQPHQSSGTVETRKIMGQLQRDNLAAFFAGKPLITPVN